MQITIKNFRGCREATLPLQGLTLVAGHNGQGKTSIAQAAAAVLCGQWQPAGIDLKKKEAESLVIDGEKKATIIVEGDTGSAKLVYPSCEYSTEGEAPYSKPLLTGQMSLLNMSVSQRVIHLLENTGMTPTVQDLEKAIPEMEGINQQRLWKKIQETSWDETCKLYKEQATTFKSDWRAATGEQWGAAKAQGWQPEDLSNGDLFTKEEDIQKEINDLKQEIHKAHAHNTRIGISREGDQEKADSLQGLEKRLADAETRLKTAQERFNEAIEEERKADKWVSTGWECPHCQGRLAIDQGISGAPDKVRKADELTPQQIEERNLKFSQIQQKKMTMRNAQDMAATERNALLPQIRDAKEAQKRIQDNQSGTKIEIASIEEKVGQLMRKGELIRKYNTATEVQKKIERALQIAACLDADGEKSIRQQKLASGLSAFNQKLATNCTVAGYKTVQVEEDLSITYDGRRYEFLSASEQYRVRVILQVNEQNEEDLPMVFDAIDILDNAGRNGLIKLLRAKVKNALLTATILKREEAPDLSKVGGKTLWLENGMVA
jgi:hypothetical protein